MVLSEFSYNDYVDITNIIDESFVINEALDENNVSKKLADKLSKITEKLKNHTATDEDIEESKKILEDLVKVSNKISRKEYKVYKILYTITIVVNFAYYLIELANIAQGFVQGLKGKADGIKLDFKDKVKASIKSFFSVKSLIKLVLLVINNSLKDIFKDLMDYAKVVDKTYEILIRTEANIMVEKRKAKKNHDSKTEEACDMVIEYIENMKRERMKQLSIAKKEKESIHESLEKEMDINTFKIVCRDIAEAISIEVENLRAYCNAATYLTRRALEVNESNKTTKINTMIKKLKSTEKFVKDDSRYYDQTTLKNIFKRYEGYSSTRFSEYGIKAREKFEDKLYEASEEIKKITDKYYKEMSIIITGKEGSSIASSIDRLKDTISRNSSYETSLDVINIVYKIDDNARMVTDFCKAYIKWCKEKTKAYDYKHSTRYFIFNKLFK